jgi:hypothetical protein
MGRKIRNAIKNCQNYIYRFYYKGNVLAEPLKIGRGTPAFRKKQFDYIALEKPPYQHLVELQYISL